MQNKSRENGGREEEEEEEGGEGEGGDGEREGSSSMQNFMKNHSNSALLDIEPPVRQYIASFVYDVMMMSFL